MHSDPAYVATLVTLPGLLASELPARAAAAVEGARVEWLVEEEACDVFLPSKEAGARLKEMLVVEPVDIIVQPVATRRKKLLITDMDSTVITVECIDELADYMGLKDKVSAITERAMNGELEFAEALIERVALLAGMQASTLQEVYDARVQFMPGAREMVKTMRENGARCVLVSGGFNFFTSRVAHALGFHADFSNQLEIVDGLLTGRVLLPILGKEAKLQTLEEECAKLRIDVSEACAVGDGANDLPMLLKAGLGIAYHAKPSVQAQTHHHINHTNLRAVLFAQGFRV